MFSFRKQDKKYILKNLIYTSNKNIYFTYQNAVDIQKLAACSISMEMNYFKGVPTELSVIGPPAAVFASEQVLQVPALEPNFRD